MASTKVKKSNLDSSVFTDLTIIGNISATGNFYNNGGLVSGGGGGGAGGGSTSGSNGGKGGDGVAIITTYF